MEAPKIPSFFKNNGPKQFNYKPWFYNEAREERERRNKIIRTTKEKTDSDNQNGFQSEMHEKWHRSHAHGKQRNKSNLRLIVIIALLVWIAYFLLK